METRRNAIASTAGTIRQETRQLATAAAGRLEQELPKEFSHLPVRPSRIALKLGLAFEQVDQLAELGHFDGDRRIRVRRGLSPEAGRVTVAHEIGHYILATRLAHLNLALPAPAREAFAEHFALELVLPRQHRQRVRADIRRATRPREITAIASQLGVYPQHVLRFAALYGGWLTGVSTIWLRVRHASNAFTGQRKKLRIVAAYYDKSSLFVPMNKGFALFAGGDEWLAAVPTGVEYGPMITTVRLHRRVENATPRFSEAEVSASIVAMRLRGNEIDRQDHFLLAVAPHLSDQG